jgi:glycosyltransferase involved in cell wall biosynthesis
MIRSVSKDTKVLLIYTTIYSKFVHWDFEILKRHFDTTAIKSGSVLDILQILRTLRKSDVCMVWFGTMTAAIVVFFAKLFRKKSIVVGGGSDVANEPDIDYGLMRRPLYRYFPKFAFRFADITLVISRHAQKELLSHLKPKDHRIIYVGIPTEYYIPKGPKKNKAMTVGIVTRNTLQRKGIESFVRTASLLPEVPFYLVGEVDPDTLDYLKALAVPNLKIMGFMPEKELINLYQETKVYVQVSKHEGFGVALAEAMLCECIPVVTRCGAIPEVVGNTGIYVPYGDPEATANAICEALTMKRSLSARNRILRNFPLKKREQEIVQVISDLLRVVN